MNEIEEIKNRLDIVELIGSYLQLKKAGANYKTLCPFHAEKTPSFMVSPQKQIWHCFGCDAGGDVIGFYAKIENLDFREALEQLAERVGVKLSNLPGIPNESKSKLLRLQELAAQFFETVLWSKPQGKPVLLYLRERGLSNETIKEFRLGFAPDMTEGLTGILLKKGFSSKEIVDSGLGVLERSGRVHDRFRGRIMFPIWNVQGKIVAFTGRVFGEESTLAKYVNSPETSIYHKSSIVYALNCAKSEILSKDFVVVVEGQMDAILSHQAGVKNCVAVSGSAATETHLKTLSRYSKNIYFCFDDDEAGQKAAERVLDMASALEVCPKVIKLPFGKDPAEVVKSDPVAWRKAVEEPLDMADYYFGRMKSIIKENEPASRRAVLSFMVEKISRVTDPVIKSDWVKKLADLTDVAERVIWDKISGKTVAQMLPPKTAKQINVTDLLEKELLTLILLAPETILTVRQKLTLEDFSTENRLFFEAIFNEETLNREKFLSSLPYEKKNEILQNLFKEEISGEKRDYAAEVKVLTDRILKKNRARKIRELRKQIKEAEAARNFELLKDLTYKFQQLSVTGQ